MKLEIKTRLIMNKTKKAMAIKQEAMIDKINLLNYNLKSFNKLLISE